MTNLPLRAWFVLRLRVDGTRDPTFGGGDGLVMTSFGRGPDAACAVAVDRRGRIVVAGTSQAGVECTARCRQLRLVRYLPGGRVDPSFGRSGKTTAPVDPAHDALGLALQPNGGIIVAGSALAAGQGQDPELALWRFDPSGRRDFSFGGSGLLAANPTSGRLNLDFLTNVIVQPDGAILASGGSSKPRTGFDSSSLSDVAVLRAR